MWLSKVDRWIEGSQARKSSDVREAHLACGQGVTMENSFADGTDAKPADRDGLEEPQKWSERPVVAALDFM